MHYIWRVIINKIVILKDRSKHGFTGIYADLEPLCGYTVTDNNDEAEYFKDFPVQINFLYTEQVW